jgi:hypothetical protein
MHHEADSYLSLYKERLSFATWEPLRVPIKPLAWDYDLIQMQTEWMLGRGPSARDYARKLMNEYKLPKDIALSARQYVGKVNGDMYPVRRYRKGETTFALSFKNLERIDTNYAQALQDMFVLAVLDGKENGTYLEIGSNAPIYNNNTYLLEQFNWRGVSVELEASYNNEFNLIRKNPAMTEDATECHYDYLLETYGIGKVVDYLQVDCEPAEVTFKALQKIPFDKYTFRVITYEHDFYQDPEGKYRELSREYLTNLGYELIIGNVGTDLNNNFEDWYVHPVHVDMKRTVTLKDTSSSIMANKKLTQEEIKQLNNFQQQRNNMLVQLGNMELTMLRLEKEKSKGLQAIDELDQMEQFYYRTLQDKYGKGRIDLDSKEFISD